MKYTASRYLAPLLVSAVLFAGQAQAAFADPRDFVLENDSATSFIYHVYVTRTDSTTWGHDVLGSDVLPPGYHTTIRFNSNYLDTCFYDIVVVTDDGVRKRHNNANLCLVSSEYYT